MGNARLRKILGMTQHPATAGQAIFGDVDVTGAQTISREQARMNEQLGEAAQGATFGLVDELGGGLRGLVGAQMTEQERRRLRNLTGAQMTEQERRRLLGGSR
jgi:hypothetical protein